jgi:hypothetical protein
MSMKAWWATFIGGLAVLVLIAISIARMYGPPRTATPDETPAPSAPAGTKETAHITATLFFGSPDGTSLVPVRRDVPLAATVVEQGRQILTAQLTAEPPTPTVSVIPAGTTLRAFYVTERGDAFVDLSPQVSTGHPGGSLNELLTVYAIVNAVSANLPATRRVQILIGGKEADTLAGHVDLRRPLTRDDSLVREATDEK